MLAELKKAFAVAHACSVRTARRDADANSERWQRFVAQYGIEAAAKVLAAQPTTAAEAAAVQSLSPASIQGVDPPRQAAMPDPELSEPEKMVKQQWNIYAHASKAWRDAMQTGDTIGAMAFGQATIKAQDAYYKALARLEQWEVSNRRLVPMSEFQALLPLLSSVFNLVRGFPAEIAIVANGQSPQTARAAGEDWLQTRFKPQALALLDKLTDQQPASLAA